MCKLHGVSKKFGKSYQKTNNTKDTNKFSLLPFKIVAIRHNTRLTTFVQLPKQSAKASCGIDRRTAVTRSMMAFTSAKRAPLIATMKLETGRSPQEPDQGSKEGDQAQLLSSEPGIGTRIALCAVALSWSSIHFPILCSSGRTRRKRCSNLRIAW